MTLQTTIEALWEGRDSFNKNDAATREAIETALNLLDSGAARVAEPTEDGWQVNQWLKKAVLLSFRLNDNVPIEMCALQGYDKVPLKYSGWTQEQFAAQGARVVPPAPSSRPARS